MFLTTINARQTSTIYSARKKLSLSRFATKEKRSSASYCISTVKLWTKKKQNLLWKPTESVSLIEHKGREEKRRFESRCNINSINCKGIDKGWKREEATRWELVLFIDQFYIYIYVKEIWRRKKKINRERRVGKIRMNFVHCYLVTYESNIVNIPALRDQFKFFLS